MKQQWWSEYIESRERYAATFYLVVTERPIDFYGWHLDNSNELVRKYIRPQSKSPLVVVIADVGQATDVNEKRKVLKEARSALVKIAESMGQYTRQMV